MSVATKRIDWHAIRDRLDMALVATALMGPAQGRRGEHGRRLWWRCPFHDDANPSLCVEPAKPYWRCFGCGEHGDAAGMAMRLRGVGFREAVAWLAEMTCLPQEREVKKPVFTQARGPGQVRSKTSTPRVPDFLTVSDLASMPTGRPVRPSMPTAASPTAGPPEKAATGPPDRPAGLDSQEAERVVADASERLWTPAGADARRYLEGRGLTERTIRRHRLGWADKIRMPRREGGTWPPSGIVIPWLDAGRLTRIKVRRLGLVKRSRYIEAFAGGWRVYPGPEAIRPGEPLAIVEGELDAVLLGQELEGLASVITTGSASSRPDGSTWLAMARCSPLFVALDSDPAGNDAASEWGGRSIRVRPPIEPPAGKDWGDAWKAEIDLRRWWVEEHFPAEFDRLERASIYEFDAGMTRETAELAAGLRPAEF